MKKTILLALAFVAGMLTINGAARRGNNHGGKVGGFNFLLALAVVFLAAIMTACGGNLRGGGLEGKSVNDALPKGAAIWHPILKEGGDHSRIIPGTENETIAEVIMQKWNSLVPCSDISEVMVASTNKGDYHISLRLVTDKYGGKYYPHAQGGRFWTNPILVVGEKEFVQNAEGYKDANLSPYKGADINRIAEHCGVKVR